MKEKVATEKKIDWLDRCRPIPVYADAKKKAQAAKDKMTALHVELQQLRSELAPTLRRVQAKKQYVEEVQRVKQEHEKAVAAAEKQGEKIDAKDRQLDEKITECDQRLEAERRSRQPKKAEKLKHEAQITNIKAQMEHAPAEFDPRDYNQQIQAKTERRRELEAQDAEHKNQIATLRNQGQERNRRVAELHQRLADLDTQAGQQQDKLERLSRDSYRAWKWIQDNKHLFKGAVFGPPVVECSLKDPRMADVIESLLQQNDFKIITVTQQDDFRLLQGQLHKKMKLFDISLRVCSITSLDNFPPPMSTEQLHRLGLESWAIDQLVGPPTVLAMLCQDKFLHQAAVSSHDISEAQYQEIAKSGMKSFVAGRTSYQFVRRAEYGAAGHSSKTRSVRPAQLWTNQPVDAGAKARLEREIGEINLENGEIKSEFDKIKALQEAAKTEYVALREESDALKREKEDKQRALTAFKALPAKLAQAEEQLAAVQANLDGTRARALAILKEKETCILAKAETALAYADAVTVLREKSEELMQVEMYLLEAQNDWETLKERNQGIHQLYTRKSEEKKKAEAAKEEEHQKAKECAARVKECSTYAQTLAETDGDHGLLDLMKAISDKSTSIEELDAEIDAEKARLELVQGVDGNIVRDFEDRAARIARLQANVHDATRQLEETRLGIRDIRQNWEPRLDELVGRISEKFGESFARIGCAGQVAVYKSNAEEVDDGDPEDAADGNGLDFANWAIHISVKFRANEPLSLLDAHRQSGGERAVSTIFYLMALQSLSRAPFRVVDEINQGMDPRNERMVHGRMVDIATPKDGEDESSGSQYFLITPKLLSGLRYRKGMTVLCIVSGENMPRAVADHEDGTEIPHDEHHRKLWKVDFRKFVKRATELGLNSQGTLGAGGRRVDAGTGGSSFGSGPVDGDERRAASRTVSIGA